MRQSVEVGATPFILALLTDPEFVSAREAAADAERAEDTAAWNEAKQRQTVIWNWLWEVVKPQPLR